MKLATFILSFIIFIQSWHISLSDVLQFGELIEHAKFHKKEYGDDFVTFLAKHYSVLKKEHAKNHQEESSKHEKLPFNEHQHIDIADFQVIPYQSADSSAKKLAFISRTTTFFYNILYISIFSKLIFHPPRFS